MFIYRWHLVDPRTNITAKSRVTYSSIGKARDSAARYAINKWSHSAPEDVIVKIYRSDGTCVYFNFVVPDIDMEGLGISERSRLAEIMIKIRPIRSDVWSSLGDIDVDGLHASEKSRLLQMICEIKEGEEK